MSEPTELEQQASSYAGDQDPGEYLSVEDRVTDGYLAGHEAALAQVRRALTNVVAPRHAELGQRRTSTQRESATIAYYSHTGELELIWDQLTDLGYADRRPFREN